MEGLDTDLVKTPIFNLDLIINLIRLDRAAL